MMRTFVIACVSLNLVHGFCDNFVDEWIYDQMVPLDKCIAKNASASYIYHCTDFNTSDDFYFFLIDEYDNWYEQDFITVVRSDYQNADCQDSPSAVSNITNLDGLYEISCGTQCDTLTFREYPVSSLSECVFDADSNDWTSYPFILDECIAYDLEFEFSIIYNCGTLDDGEWLWWTETFLGSDCSAFNRIEREYHRNAYGCAQNDELNAATSNISIQLTRCDAPTTDTLFAQYTAVDTDDANDECGNYWIPEWSDDVYGEYEAHELIPFDECISTHVTSYKFACDPAVADEIYKVSYSAPHCQGDGKRMLFTEKTAKYINCKPENACDVFKMTDYYTESIGNIFNDPCDEFFYANNLAQYPFKEVLISTSPCFVDETGKTSSLSCDAIGTVSKQFNGDTCDNSRVETLSIGYHNATDCSSDIIEGTVRLKTYECYSPLPEATTTSSGTKSTTDSKPPFSDASTKEKSSSWTVKLIVVSVSIIVAFALVLLFGCWYNKMKESQGYANLELLRLVNED